MSIKQKKQTKSRWFSKKSLIFTILVVIAIVGIIIGINSVSAAISAEASKGILFVTVGQEQALSAPAGMVVTQWTPDTGGGIFEYYWNPKVSENQRVHTYFRVVSLDSIYTSLGVKNDITAYNKALDENTRKNIVWATALSIRTTLTLEQYYWKFGSTRQLVVYFEGMNASQKNTLKTQCTTLFGVGKVAIVTSLAELDSTDYVPVN